MGMKLDSIAHEGEQGGVFGFHTLLGELVFGAAGHRCTLTK